MQKTIDTMPQHLQAALNKHAIWDLLKEQAKESIVAHQVDFVELSEQFVLRKAKNTQVSYKIGLSLFFLIVVLSAFIL